ncbi:MAG: S41 family peptidase [Rubrivivax sp.]
MAHRRHVLHRVGAAAAAGLCAPWTALRAATEPVGTGRGPDGSALQADVDLLAQALRALHPGLQRYLSEADFQTGVTALGQAWAASAQARSMAEGQRLRALSLSRLLGTLRCGHTYTNFYNQRGAVREALCLAPPRLPLHFDWLDDGAVVTAAHPSVGALVRPGDRLMALNGEPMATVREALLPLVRADGHNRFAQLALLAPGGHDEFETWDVLHPLVYGHSAVFEVQLQAPDGTPRRASLPGLTQAQRLRMRRGPTAEPSDATPPWPLRWLDDGSAVLTMPGWAMYRTRWDWRAYIETVFQRLQTAGTPRLVVDLRGNEGGLDCGDELLARLVRRPLDTRLYERRTRYRQVPAALNPHLDTWDNSFRDWGDRVQPVADGFYAFADAGSPAIAPRGTAFSGPVAVLVDGANHSATFRFLQLFRRAGRGLLVGSPTGGNQRGINGGSFFFLRLPASGLEVDLPLVGSFAPPGTPDAGLAPDVAVAATLADVVAGRDAVLQRAVAALKAG